MLRAIVNRRTFVAVACVMLGSCGGGDDGGNLPPLVAIGPPAGPGASPAPTPSPSNPQAPSVLPPAPFGLTASADFPIVGWQQTSQEDAGALIALAEKKGVLAWSADLKTYTITLADLATGRLVYTFPGNNPAAFSIIQADGSTAKVYVTIWLKTANTGEVYWQTADGVRPFVYAHAIFGMPFAGSLPTIGRRVFTTDTSPQSSIVFDFATRKVSGTVTSFNDGGGWYPEGPKEQATLEPADIQPDGSFVAAITIPGAPKTGELRGRLFGPAGTDLGVYWNAPARTGYADGFEDWRAVTVYPACSSCTG